MAGTLGESSMMPGSSSKKIQLLVAMFLRFGRDDFRFAETRVVEGVEAIVAVEAKTGHGFAKALTEEVGPQAFSVHARGEICIVIFSAAHGADAVQHPFGALGKMHLQPLLEQRVHLP